MKLSTYFITASTALGLALPAIGALSVGTIINMDYDATNGTGSGAGVIGSAGDTWNLGGTGNNNGLVDSTNTATGINNFQDTVNGGSTSAFGWGSDAITQDYIYLRDDNISTVLLGDGSYAGVGRRLTIYVSGNDDLNGDQTWDLHLIGAGDNGQQGANFMLKQDDGMGGFTWTTLTNDGNPAPGSSYISGDNLATFSSVTPTAWGGGNHEFELYWFWTDPDTTVNQIDGTQSAAGAGGNRFTAFNGFQMELLSVPEPSSVLLGAFGGLFLLRRRR